MRYFSLLMVLFFTIGNMNALAAPAKKAKKAKKEYVHHEYGMAGCGLGSLAIQGKGTGEKIFAATTNDSTYTQSFGISSGTSNCTPDDSAAKQEQEVFIDVNFDSLKKEAAKGEGEYLDAFADLMGCDKSSFLRKSQTYYNELYDSDNTKEVLQNHYKVFAHECDRIKA